MHWCFIPGKAWIYTPKIVKFLVLLGASASQPARRMKLKQHLSQFQPEPVQALLRFGLRLFCLDLWPALSSLFAKGSWPFWCWNPDLARQADWSSCGSDSFHMDPYGDQRSKQTDNAYCTHLCTDLWGKSLSRTLSFEFLYSMPSPFGSCRRDW